MQFKSHASMENEQYLLSFWTKHIGLCSISHVRLYIHKCCWWLPLRVVGTTTDGLVWVVVPLFQRAPKVNVANLQ